jgi:hypothetical protein
VVQETPGSPPAPTVGRRETRTSLFAPKVGRIFITTLLATACREKVEVVTETPDPVATVERWLRQEVFADPPTLAFAPDLKPADFPARQVRAENYRFLDLWRVRQVDARLLIDALVSLDGQPHVLPFYLEEVEGVWRVAGFAAAEPIENPGAAPPGGANLPGPLAAATFRGAPPAQVVYVAPATEGDEEGEDARLAVRVGFHDFVYTGECPTGRLGTALRRSARRIGTCHVETFGSKPRAGRLTFDVTLQAGQAPEVVLRETTLLAGALTECVAEALGRLPPEKASHCTVRVPITFSPRR